MATVASTTRFTTATLASATAGPFDVGFRLFEPNSIKVYVNDVEVVTGWTLNLNLIDGFDDNATVLFNTPLSSGDVVSFEGAISLQREEDYEPSEIRLTDKINAEFARAWASLIELKRKAETGSSGDSGTTPAYRRQWDLVTSSATLTSGQSVATDTSGGAFTVLLPETPEDGDAVSLSVILGDPETNNLTINGNGNRIGGQGFASDFVLIVDLPLPYVELAYFTTLGEWKLVDYAVPTGADGTEWHVGAGAPSGALGVDEDFYLNSTNGDVYKKASGSWSVVDNLTGPAGAAMDWTGPWVTETTYTTGQGTANGGSSYICTADHTSAALTEPGVGANWQTVWDLMAAQGSAGAGSGDMIASTYDPQAIGSDAFARGNHTGTQTLATISDAGTAAASNTGDFATAAQGGLADTAMQPADIANMVESDVTGITGADAITNIVSLTQAEYDAITPDAATLYVVTS